MGSADALADVLAHAAEAESENSRRENIHAWVRRTAVVGSCQTHSLNIQIASSKNMHRNIKRWHASAREVQAPPPPSEPDRASRHDPDAPPTQLFGGGGGQRAYISEQLRAGRRGV
eukprot:9471053-Pyramimonas_sp.AAC.1